MRVFDHLVANEFVDREVRTAQLRTRLAAILGHAAHNVPYYRETYPRHRQGSRLQRIRDLRALPILAKEDIHRHAAQLQALTLPAGERHVGATTSSGTTGHPIRIKHSERSTLMFSILYQRQCRCFRLDAEKSLAYMREPGHMPASNGKPIGLHETLSTAWWPYVGNFFVTGPAYFYSSLNTPDDQALWLEQQEPAYLLGYAANLEQLSYAIPLGHRPPNLEGLIAVAQTLTDSMRRRVETVFQVPVHQNYGLNEVGLVAMRCPAGNYHVHTEHCMVEIVDDEGNWCAPGETGRLLVTAFNNFVMPLIRYDTGDIARAGRGECPCGRTLPFFADLIGRTRRYALCPPGTFDRVYAIRRALDAMPPELALNMRRYQLHQYRDGSYQMRVKVVGPLPKEFIARVNNSWSQDMPEPPPLRIIEVSDLPRPPGGKYESFTSDYN